MNRTNPSSFLLRRLIPTFVFMCLGAPTAARAAEPIHTLQVTSPATEPVCELKIGLHVYDDKGSLPQLLATQGLSLNQELRVAVETALRAVDYSVVPPGSAADAHIDLTVDECSYERRVWGKVGPHLVVSVNGIDGRTGKQLFSETYSYDMYAHTITYTMLRPDDRFGFDAPADVFANPDTAVAGLRAAFPMIGNEIVKELQQ